MTDSLVQLYIYELSNGLARQMSPLLLGKQIDGIWHTGVVCFGKEFFFGGGGIEYCPPGGTILGMPDEVVDLGHTEISEDLFMEYLRGLGMEEFRPEKYHLFEHNCNTFSNEIAVFLTGQKIPRHIQDLPQDVLNSAFGQMIRPLVDSMRVTPAGGSTVTSNSQSSSSSSHRSRSDTSDSSTLHEDPNNPESIFEPREKGAKSAEKLWEPLPPTAVIYTVDNVDEKFQQLKEEMMKDQQGGSNDVVALDELRNAMSYKKGVITEEHVKFVEIKVQQCLASQGPCLLLLLEIVQALCLDKKFMELNSVKKFLWTIIEEFSSSSSKSTDVHVTGVKALCNAVSSHAGHTTLVSNSPCPHISSVAASSLLTEHQDLMMAGAALAFNVSRYKVNEDIALECSTAIIEVLNKGASGEIVYHCLYALQRFMDYNKDIAGLVAVMGVDLAKYQGQSDEVDQLCEKLQVLFS